MRKAVCGITLVLLLSSILPSALIIRPVKAEWAGTVYINADGSVDPPGAPVTRTGNVYTLIGDIMSYRYGIVIEKDDVIINGAGHKLRGSKSDTGVYIKEQSNVTINNFIIDNYDDGVFIASSSNITIAGNTIINELHGISVAGGIEPCIGISILENLIKNNLQGITISICNTAVICDNNITDNKNFGLSLGKASNNIITGNTFINDGMNIDPPFNCSVFLNNTVNGKPLIYLENISDAVIQDAGQVILVNCNRVRIENCNLSNASIGVGLWNTHNTSILRNNIAANRNYGVHLFGSSNNSIFANNITNNSFAIDLCESNTNKIFENNIIANFRGVWLESGADNLFYHNNFVDNQQQCVIFGYESGIWDDGYPSGGNYWSDYVGVDSNGDGIGDTPYTIDAKNRDRYPLMDTYVIPEFPQSPLLLLPTITLLTASILLREKRKNKP
jgi:parallel beta-helix repeat protein